MNALSNLRIIELGTGPTVAVTTMILADFGAEVLTIQPPRPGLLDQHPAAPMWRRGKAICPLDLDLEGDQIKFAELLASADVLVTNWRTRKLAARALDFETLSARFPHLNYCQITGFGMSGPLADLPGYEHVAAAYAGRMLQFAGIADRPGPVWSAVQVATHVAIQSSVTGILAAVLQQASSARGRHIETSLLKGLLPYDMGGLIALQKPERYAQFIPLLSRNDQPPKPSLYYHPAQAGDGRWMQFGNLLPHLFDNFLIATDLIDVLADPLYDPKQMLLIEEAAHEAFRARMLARIQSRDSSAWMQAMIEDGGIVATVYQSTQDALDDPDLVANGHVVPLDAEGVQIGPLAKLSETPASISEAIDDAAPLINAWLETPRATPITGRHRDPPLKGIRVIELATIIAAPLGASILADLGADVIKIEPLSGDPFRSMMDGLGAMRVNAGKRSLAVDLKSVEGKALVLDLISKADVVLHNYRPGVPERLGIDYDTVKALNPRIVYLQSNGYGPLGPSAHRPSTHPIPGASVGGVFYQMGESLPSTLENPASLVAWTSKLMRANELNPDPNTSVVIASSALLGLSARQRTGLGQQIMIDMFGTNAYANADDFIRYPGKKPRPRPDANFYGLAATYRLYACAGDTWVFLAVPSEAEQANLIKCFAEAHLDQISQVDLARNDDETATQLSAVFKTRTADDWMALCVPRGVACVRADQATPAHFWHTDQQVETNHLKLPAKDAEIGTYLRHGALVSFDQTPTEVRGAPLAGEHSVQILRAEGLSDDDIERLIKKGIIGTH